MANFIYAIEKVRSVSAKLLEATGLSAIIEPRAGSPCHTTQRYITQGPSGEDCTLIMAGDEASLLYYKPAEQTWQKGINGKYWVGFYNNDRPTEPALRRTKQLAGHLIELNDGKKWLIPIARIPACGSALPQALILGSKGEVFAKELPQYAMFGAKVETLWEDFKVENKLKEGTPQLTITERMQLVIEAIAWNYHAGPDEVNALKLLTTANLNEALEAILDVPTLLEIIEENEKKNLAGISDGSSSSSGDGDS